MRAASARTIAVAAALVGCGEYGFSPKSTEPDPPRAVTDTGAAWAPPVDSAPPEDTAETADTPSDSRDDTGGVTLPGDETEPPPGIALDPVYACTATDLYTIEPSRGDATWIGAFHDSDGAPVTYFLDLAIDLDGVLYGGTFDTLYRIDAATAEVTPLCALGVDSYALTVTADGAMYAGGYSTINHLDPTDCSATPLVDGAPYNTAGDLVGLPDGYLYWTVWGATFGQDDLVRVDPATGAMLRVGALSVDRTFGVAYDGGWLYAFTDDGEIVSVDPGSGWTTVLADGATEWWGATTNTVTW